MKKTRIVLFGMTGFGNNVFNALMNMPSVDIVGVFIPKTPEGPFPYYKCPQLRDVVKKANGFLYEGEDLRTESAQLLIRCLSPDLIVVSSFNQIIPVDVIKIPRLGTINVHPSLLPKYRGATPTTWAILNGEEYTGVTIHFIENEKIDSGRIILQRKVNISPKETDGSLRKWLANIAGQMTPAAVNMVINGGNFETQEEKNATYQHMRTVNDSYLLEGNVTENDRIIRAMSPYPGARLRTDKSVIVLKSEKGYIVRVANERQSAY